MVARIFTLVTLLVISAAISFSSPLRDGSLSAISNGTNITVRWLSEDEAGVLRYEIERKSGVNGQFILVAPVTLRGNNSAYEFIDDSAFRVVESIYQYQLKVIFGNGSPPVYYGPITVIHDVSSVRRTWGSIKAMFR